MSVNLKDRLSIRMLCENLQTKSTELNILWYLESHNHIPYIKVDIIHRALLETTQFNQTML